MRTMWIWLLPVVVSGCGSPTGASAPPQFAGSFLLQVDGSPSCRSGGGNGALPIRHFEWLVEAVKSPDPVAFRLPPEPDPLSLDGLTFEVWVDGSSLRGFLSGVVRVDRRQATGYRVSFDYPGLSTTLTGVVSSGPGGRAQVVGGTLAGPINIGLYASAFGGVCYATDHSWSLLPI